MNPFSKVMIVIPFTFLTNYPLKNSYKAKHAMITTNLTLSEAKYLKLKNDSNV